MKASCAAGCAAGVAHGADVEDIIQECYCKLAQLSDTGHITQPRAYLFAMARNLVLRRLKNARIVRIEAIADMDSSGWESDAPSPRTNCLGASGTGAGYAQRSPRCLNARDGFSRCARSRGFRKRRLPPGWGSAKTVVENEASRSLRAILRILSQPSDGIVDNVHRQSKLRSRNGR